jgi:hypothetical protein
LKCNEILTMPQEDDFHLYWKECPDIVLILFISKFVQWVIFVERSYIMQWIKHYNYHHTLTDAAGFRNLAVLVVCLFAVWNVIKFCVLLDSVIQGIHSWWYLCSYLKITLLKQFNNHCTLTLFYLIQHFTLAQGSSTGLRSQLDAFSYMVKSACLLFWHKLVELILNHSGITCNPCLQGYIIFTFTVYFCGSLYTCMQQCVGFFKKNYGYVWD